jgi:signal transduction histidine kinase/DNA-binding response OmpR family regulator
MRKLIIFLRVILFLLPTHLACQTIKDVVKYKQQLKEAQHDSVRVEKLWQIAFSFAQVYPDSGIPYAEKAMLLARDIKYAKGLADASNILGLCLSNSGKYREADAHFQLSISIFSKLDNPCFTTVALGNRGWNFYHQHNYTEALKQFFTAEQIDRRCLSRGWKSTSYYNIGVAYNALHAYEKALPYFERAIMYDLQSKDSVKLAIAIQGKANALRDLKNYKEAKEYYEMAKGLFKRLSDAYSLAYSYENIAELEFLQSNYTAATNACKKALSIFISLNRKNDALYEYSLLAKIQLAGRSFSESRKNALDALKLSKELNDPYTQNSLYEILSQLEQKQNKFKEAMLYMQLANNLRDSLQEIELRKTQEELAVRFESEKKDRLIELERLKKSEAEKAEKQQKQEKYLWLLGAISALLLVAFVSLRLRLSRKTELLLKKENAIIAKEKEKAEENELAKHSFLATMSHELRGPISALQGMLRLIRVRELPEKEQVYLNSIKNLSNQIQRVADDVLESERLDAGKLLIKNEPFDLIAELLHFQQVYTSLTKEKGLTFLLKSELGKSKYVLGDKLRFGQIIHNLLNNSLKFTPLGTIEMHVEKKGDLLTVDILDTGVGIEPHLHPNLFTPFRPGTKSSSSGLGLSIAKRLAERMNGNLVLKQSNQLKTWFQLSLPMPDFEPIEKDIPLFEESVFSGIKGNILVVEDDPYAWVVSRDTIQKIFPDLHVVGVSSGKEAIDEIEADEYDLIIMDIHLPDIKGTEVSKILRNSGYTLPILAFTASVLEDEKLNCITSGMNAIISKPFQDSQLVNAIYSALNQNITPTLPLLQKSNDEKDINLLLENFLPKKIKLAEQALSKGDFKSLQIVLHGMRPLLSDCGLIVLSEKAETLELTDSSRKDFYTLVNLFIVDLKKELTHNSTNND